MPRKIRELGLTDEQLKLKERFRRREITREEVGIICRDMVTEINDKRKAERLIGMIFGQKPAFYKIGGDIEGQIVVRDVLVRF